MPEYFINEDNAEVLSRRAKKRIALWRIKKTSLQWRSEHIWDVMGYDWETVQTLRKSLLIEMLVDNYQYAPEWLKDVERMMHIEEYR